MSKQEYWTETLTPPKLWTIYLIQLNEGYQINCIYPFVVFMIRDFNFAEEDVGFYAGLLTAAFCLSQFLASYFWGYLSDLYGRKIALLIGLIFSAITISAFGASKTYAQALIARSIAGIMNGNIGVTRAYIEDITNSKNRAFAFSMFAAAFSVGIVLGSSAGGLLINTFELDADGGHKESIGVLKLWIFDTKFPYLLPCLIGSIVSLISFIFTWIYIKDVFKSNDKLKYEYDAFNNEISMGGLSVKREQSLSKSLPLTTIDKLSIGFSDNSKQKRLLPQDDTTMKELYQISVVESNACAMSTNAAYETIKSFQIFKPEKSKLIDKNKNDNFIQINSIKDLFLKTKIFNTLIINLTMMLMIFAWDSIVPYYMVQILKMDSTQIGIYIAWTGIVLCIFTLITISTSYLIKIINYKTLYIVFSLGMLIIILVFPSISEIPNVLEWNQWLLLSLISFVGGFKHVFATFLIVSSMCFLNNSVPSNAISRANGLVQALQVLRCVAPLFGGMIWSWSMTLNNKYAVYITYLYLFIPSTYSLVHCYLFIKNSQITWEERENQKKAKTDNT